MADWELMLLVDPLTEALADQLCEEFDAVIGLHKTAARGEPDVIVSVTAEGPSATVAARSLIIRLRALGVRVRRLYEDLVSRSMIAERADVTPQAVGQWIRGERQSFDFPRPYTHAGGGLWLWSEVNRWLHGIGLGDGMCHPDRVDYIEVNHWLLASHEAWASVHQLSISPSTSPAIAQATSLLTSRAETGSRFDFGRHW